LRSKYDEDNKKLALELEETRRKLEEANQRAQVPDELRRLQDDRNLDELLNTVDWDRSSIGRDDAKNLLGPMLSTMRKQNSSLEESFKNSLVEIQTKYDSTVSKLTEAQKISQDNATRNKILKAHPDAPDLEKTEEYHKIIQSPVYPGSNLLMGSLIAAEFQMGKVDTLINVFNHIKGNQPSLANIASVSPTGVGSMSATVSDNPEDLLDGVELADLQLAMQSGKISMKDYRDRMKKHGEAKRVASQKGNI